MMSWNTGVTSGSGKSGGRQFSRRRVLAAAGTAGATGLAGCLSGDDTTGETSGDNSLVNKAKEEGSLTLYSVIDGPAINDTILPTFKEDYPWVDVEAVGLGPSEIASRMSSEHQASQVQADVAWNTQTSMTPLESNGVFRSVSDISQLQKALGVNDYPDFLKQEYWVPAIQNPQTVVYNTDSLSASDVPDTYEGWTDSTWNERLVIDHPRILNVAAGEFASFSSSMDESSWTDTMKGIAANKPRLTQSASESFRVVAQGEADLGIGLINNYIVGQQKDSPPSVEIAWVKPNVSLNVPLYLASDAPHPAMSVLFASWLMSPSGQISSAKTGNTPTQPELAQATFSEYIPSDVELRPVASDVPSYFENPNQWSSKFEKLFA